MYSIVISKNDFFPAIFPPLLTFCSACGRLKIFFTDKIENLFPGLLEGLLGQCQGSQVQYTTIHTVVFNIHIFTCLLFQSNKQRIYSDGFKNLV